VGKKIDGDLPLRSLEIKGKWLGLVEILREILRDLRSWEKWKDGDCVEVLGEFNTEYTEGVFDERNWYRTQRDLTALDFFGDDLTVSNSRIATFP
jgi:hypothetical protein